MTKKSLLALGKKTGVLAVLQFGAARIASAHHVMDGEMPQTFSQGLLSGFAHPVIGPDHFLFLLIAGCLVFFLPSLSRYSVAGVFVVAALFGTGVHMAGVGLPLTESVIALSVLTGGLLIWGRRRLTAMTLSLLLAGFAVFHGYAYAETIIGATNTPLGAYLLGLSVIQYLVIVGVGVVLQLTGAARKLLQKDSALRYSGAVAAVVGGVFLLQGFV